MLVAPSSLPLSKKKRGVETKQAAKYQENAVGGDRVGLSLVAAAKEVVESSAGGTPATSFTTTTLMILLLCSEYDASLS